jgi:hypothetical protein
MITLGIPQICMSLKHQFFRINPDEMPSNGLSEAPMKISQAQGFHPRRAQGYFHTNPDESLSNRLSEAMMKIKRTQGFHPRRVKFDFHTNPDGLKQKGVLSMDRKNIFLGIVLIMAGILIGLSALNLMPKISILFILAGGFLVAYFVFDRNIGFLIPGCILAAIATFITLGWQNGFNGIYILLLLGLAFFAIFLIHTMHIKTNQWGDRYWPLFPGSILMIIGTLILNAQLDPLDPNRKIITMITPVFLIVIGMVILFGGTKKSS